MNNWEKVTDKPLDDTWKIKVPGGYIYRYVSGAYHSVAMVFVPDVFDAKGVKND